jgi:hypothetical protein
MDRRDSAAMKKRPTKPVAPRPIDAARLSEAIGGITSPRDPASGLPTG